MKHVLSPSTLIERSREITSRYASYFVGKSVSFESKSGQCVFFDSIHLSFSVAFENSDDVVELDGKSIEGAHIEWLKENAAILKGKRVSERILEVALRCAEEVRALNELSFKGLLT